MTRLGLPVAAALALVAGCMLQGSGEQELRTRVPGTWRGTTPDGVELTMLLKPDGSGEVNGHPGTWEIKVGRILLSDGEHLVPCDLSGDELTCHTPDGDLVMTRADVRQSVTTTTPPAAAPPAKEFAPEKTVAGQPFIAPANGPIGGASFTMPDGWTHNVVSASGQKVHMLLFPEVESASITVARLPSRERPTRERLSQVIASYGVTQEQVVLAPEEIDVAGQAGVRAIVTHEATEYYGAIVGGKDVIFVIVGRYPPDKAESLRPVVETVLGSFRASP
jgi:hypothetical protein